MVCLCLTASINRLKVKCLKFRSSVLALRSDTIVNELLKEITATSFQVCQPAVPSIPSKPVKVVRVEWASGGHSR